MGGKNREGNSPTQRHLEIRCFPYFCAMAKEVWQLLRLYWTLEGKNRQVLSGVFLYVVAIVLVSNYIFGTPDHETWLAIYWFILVFAAVNAGILSFAQESGGRRWYYVQLAEPISIYLAKSIYILALLGLVSVVTLALMALFFGIPIQAWGLFLSSAALAGLGLSFLFGFLSAIAGQTRQSANLSTILGFPLLIGVVMLAGKITAASLMIRIQPGLLRFELMMLAGLDLLIAGTGVLLFAYIWRD